VVYMQPILTANTVSNLLAAAGLMQGVGDWRPEKGNGTYGQFKLVNDNDPDWQRVVAAGGRKAQQAAMESPETYDAETDELLGWFDAQVAKR